MRYKKQIKIFPIENQNDVNEFLTTIYTNAERGGTLIVEPDIKLTTTYVVIIYYVKITEANP